jgi:hypothetical protein
MVLEADIYGKFGDPLRRELGDRAATFVDDLPI